jgi:hypothetical protein
MTGERWYEAAVGSGMIRVLARDEDHARERMEDELRDLGLREDSDPALRAAYLRMKACA